MSEVLLLDVYGLISECNAPSCLTDLFSFKAFLTIPSSSPGLPKACIFDSFAVGVAFGLFQVFFKKKIFSVGPFWFLISEVWHSFCVQTQLLRFLVPFSCFFVVFVRCPVFLPVQKQLGVRLLSVPLMSAAFIWVAAQVLHPFQHNVYVQMWWQEARQPSVRKTGVFPPLGNATCSAPDAASAGLHATPSATMLVAQAAVAVASPRRGSQGWCSSTDEGDNYQGTSTSSQPSSQRLPTPRISSSFSATASTR